MRKSAFLKTEPWQLRYLFDLGFQGWMVHVGVVLLTSSMMVSALPEARWPFLWLGAMLLLSVTLGFLCRAHATGAYSDERLIRAGYAHTALTGAVGLVWAAGALGVTAGSFNLLAVYSLALGGTALGAVSSQHAVLRSALTSIWSSVPVLGVAHIVESGVLADLPIALMMLLYAMILSILALRMHRFLTANHDLTLSLDAKVSELTVALAGLKAANLEAKEANLAKSRFLAQASHDLRQPIHAIGLLTASLKATRLSREQKQMLASVDQSVDSVTNLFASLLDISRIETGGVEPRPVPVDLGAFMRRVVHQNRELASKAGCTLRFVPTKCWVETDPNLLFTMVQNVLSNAFKYAPGSRILLGLRRAGRHTNLQISDTGPGIDPAHTEAVFSEYVRLEINENLPTVEGMGLGLSIVRRLGGLLGLDVTLASQLGIGTSVLISGFEPVAPVDAGPPPAVLNHPLSGRRICLVEDDEKVRLATASLLERWGCKVTAWMGQEEIGGEYDAILTDMHLGTGKDGLTIIAELRGRIGSHLPAIVLTGRSDEATLSAIHRAGIPVLGKPVAPPELRAALTRICLEADTPVAGGRLT